MRLVVKKNEIYEIEKDMLSKVDNIYQELDSLKKIKENLQWKGKSYNSYIKKHDDIIENEKKLIYKLEKLISFLDDVLLNYDYAIEEIDGEYRKAGGR